MMSFGFLRKQHNAFNFRFAILLAGVIFVTYSEVLERFDFIIYDKLSTLKPYSPDPDIVIVAIDDESLKVLGHWPWSRELHAEFINRLITIGNKAVALDVLFLESQQTNPNADWLLAAAIARHGNVVFPVVPVSEAYSELLTLAKPLSIFTQHALLGHADVELDTDGVARRIFLYAGINRPTWPAFALALANPALARTARQIGETNPEPLEQQKYWVRAQEVLIPYASAPNSFHKISYSRVLFDDEALMSLKDKTVLIGMTATGMGTRFATPASPLHRQPMTGVEWHANVFSMLTNNRAIHTFSTITTACVSVAWMMGILTILVWTKINLTIPLLVGLVILGLTLSGLFLALGQIWMPPAAALMGTLSLYPLLNWQRIDQFLRSFWITKLHSSAALESIDDGVIITDATNHILYLNKGAERILCTQLDRIKGKFLQEVLNFCTKTSDFSAAQTEKDILSTAPDQPEMIECVIKTIHGKERTVRITCNQLYDEHEIKLGSVIALTDITDKIELVQQVVHQQSHDGLTKLPNRSKLLIQFNHMINTIQDKEIVITVIFVTLDNFKKINDAMGHHAGDKLLTMVSSRLFECVISGDVIARWGGDEFVLLSNRLDKEDSAPKMAQKILDTMRQRFEIDGLEVFVSVSIGISFYPQDGLSSETVLARASTAMYRVKQDGGNHYGMYSPESSLAWTRDQLELERELRTAIQNNELHVLFQPIINAQSQCITRMEALVRWSHPKRGYLSPSEFIPLAEDIGQIEQLGKVVLQASCTAAYQLLQLGFPVNVSVNVNPRQLLNKDFPQTISQVLYDTGLPAKFLILEITESAIVSNMERVNTVLKEIRRMNVLIALDDFGTGYSSLTLLRDFPIDILKIDKSFIRTLDQNFNDLKIVQAIIGLGRNLGLTIIAEGVETEQQAGLLLQHECYFHQGYYFSRPVSYDALFQLIQDKKNTMPHQSAQ